MTYNPNIPQPNDFIDESQPELLGNLQELDAVFDVDHYKYSDGSGNKGKHRTVTSPAESAHVSTAADEPVIYSFEDLAAIGVLHYSRGGSDAVPTPLTSLHGTIASLAGSSTQSILDISGLSVFYANLFVGSLGGTPGSVYAVIGTASGASVTALSSPGTLRFSASGTEILVQNVAVGAVTDVNWTIQPLRIEV